MVFVFLGRHPCLFCIATKAEIQLPPSERSCEPRTLAQMKNDLERFRENGADLKFFKMLEDECCLLDVEVAHCLGGSNEQLKFCYHFLRLYPSSNFAIEFQNMFMTWDLYRIAFITKPS